MLQRAELAAAVEREHPRHWLGPSPLYDLEDPKLRLRVRALTQLCQTEREKALALYAYVKRLPLAKVSGLRARTARQVYDAGRGDARGKATLLVAMLRIAGIPARLRFVRLAGEILRGVPRSQRELDRPLVEIWIQQRWLRTDTYILAPACMAEARHRLKERGWEWGCGIHVSGAMVWDGHESAYLGGVPTECDLMVVRELGTFQDALAYQLRWRPSPAGRAGALLRELRQLLAALAEGAWRRLRVAPARREVGFQQTL